MRRLACLLVLAAAPATAQNGPCGLYESVEPDDDLATIATRCAVTEADLLAANPGLAAERLPVGASLALAPPIPPGARYAALIGRYAPGGDCAGGAALDLRAETVGIDGAACTFARAEALPGALVVTATDCDGGGGRSFALVPLAGGGVELQGGYGATALGLCREENEGDAPQPSNP